MVYYGYSASKQLDRNNYKKSNEWGIHLHVLARGQHRFEKTSQQWLLIDRPRNSTPTSCTDNATTEPTGQFLMQTALRQHTHQGRARKSSTVKYRYFGIFLLLVACLSSYHEKAIKAL